MAAALLSLRTFQQSVAGAVSRSAAVDRGLAHLRGDAGAQARMVALQRAMGLAGAGGAALPAMQAGAVVSRDRVACMRGTAVLRRCRAAIEVASFTPSEVQARVINAFFASALPLLYKSDWLTHGTEVAAYWGLCPEEIRSKTAMKCPRRNGKTVAMAMVAASLLVCADGLDMIIAATGLERAKSFISMVHGFLEEMREPGTGLSASAARLSLDLGGGVRNALVAISSNSTSGRGVTGQVIFVDEGAFVAQKLFEEVLYPLAAVDGTVMFIVSSPALYGTDCFSGMFEAKYPDGRYLFNRIELKLICASCQRDKRLVCTHTKARRVPWQTAEAHAELRILYSTNKEAYMREVLGADSAGEIAAFTRESLERLRASPPRALCAGEVRRVFLSLDPSGGGAGSDSALCITAFGARDELVVSEAGRRAARAEWVALGQHRRRPLLRQVQRPARRR